MSFTDFIEETKEIIISALDSLGYPRPEDLESAEPPDKEYGDLSFRVAFQISKQTRKKPSELALQIARKAKEFASQARYVESIEAHPSGFLNFKLNKMSFYSQVLREAGKQGYGKITIGSNQRVLIEHTSVNPNGALHIGHMRNVAIGDCLARVFAFASYSVQVLNYIDDSGLQVADLIVGMKYLGFSEDSPQGVKYDHYTRAPIYVQVTKKYDEDSSLLKKRELVLKQIEQHDPDIIDLVFRVTDRVLREQLKTCWRFGAYYDLLVYESDIIGTHLWSTVFEELKTKGIARFVTEGKLAGTWVVTVKGESEGEDKVLVRSNGVATYIAKDTPFAALKMGLVKDRFSYSRYVIQPNGKQLWRTMTSGGEVRESPVSWNPDKALTPIDDRQARLQRIIQYILSELAGQSMENRYIHVGYAIVSLSPKTAQMLGTDENEKQTNHYEKHSVTMAGRKGIFVYGDDALDALKRRALEETRKRNPDSNDSAWLESVSEKIAISALRYSLLKQDLDKVIVFDLEESLRLVGETGPYLLYTYARASSIITKWKKDSTEQGLEDGTFVPQLKEETEIDLAKLISKFSIAVEKAVKMIAPKWIAHYSYEICEAFNKFYETNRVLQEPDPVLRRSRLKLVFATQNVLRESLGLLGIDVLERI
jgi:arginyl-tRNA synthetase